MPSQVYLDLAARLERGDGAATAAMLALAEAGDPDAAFKAADLHLRGASGRADPRAAHRLLGAAADAGHAGAKRAKAYFTAAGLGCRADADAARAMLEAVANEDSYARTQLAFLEHLSCHERLKTAERRLLSTDPHVELILQLFSPHECRYIQAMSSPNLKPAMIMTTTGTGVRDPHRDSDNAMFDPLAEDLVIQAINRCIAAATKTKASQGEPLNILRYGPGQRYLRHHDAHGFGPVAERRTTTALLYLNDDYEGGETEFPELGFRVAAGTGDLLIFRNLRPDKQPDMRLIHAGLPIIRGEKWVASRWIRGGDFFPQTKFAGKQKPRR